MSIQVVADTHALIWYLFEPERLSRAAFGTFEETIAAGRPILVSAISLVEILYLEEKGRFLKGTMNAIRNVCEEQDPDVKIVPVDEWVAHHLAQIIRTTVPDMPDRIIAATALSLGIPLVTRDEKIRASGIPIIVA